MSLLLMMFYVMMPLDNEQAGYEMPDSEIFLNAPYDMDFDAAGRLYVADRNNCQILVWNADKTFAFAFGRKGEGPGEFANPVRLRITGDELYLFDQTRKISVFDLDGTYKRSFFYSKDMRTMAALGPDLMLVMYRDAPDPTNINISFELVNGKGEQIRQLMSFKDALFLGPVEGSNNAKVKAYAADGDIQYAGDGTWLFGYGSERKLHRIDSKGEIIETLRFDLVTDKPTDDEIRIVKTMSFPAGGGRLSLDDLPNLKMHYNYDKDYFTQFAVRGDKVVFALTPIGGTDGVGIGYSQAPYAVCDLKSGKRLAVGRYQFSEDSMVLYNSGRAMGFVINDDEEYEIREIELKGLPQFKAI